MKTIQMNNTLLYEIHPARVLKLMEHFTTYRNSPKHRLRIALLTHCEKGKWRFNGLRVRAYVVDYLNGRYDYIISFFDKNHKRRINVKGGLTHPHFKYLIKHLKMCVNENTSIDNGVIL